MRRFHGQTIKNDNVFRDDTLNIFTDASTYGNDACAGCVVVRGRLEYQEYIEQYLYLENTDSLEAEMQGIYLGLRMALPYICQHTVVRLFSDSNTSIIWLRDKGSTMQYKSNNIYLGNSMMNERYGQILYTVVSFILQNNLNIEFYHQKGHVNAGNISDMMTAMEAFNRLNRVNLNDSSLEFIQTISRFNDHVDMQSRALLHQQQGMMIDPFQQIPQKENFKDYKNHIVRKMR